MSDLQSELRRLHEQLGPDEWRANVLMIVSGQPHGMYGGREVCHFGGGHGSGDSQAAKASAVAELKNLLPRILTALAPAVKPLVWEPISEGALCAATPFGLYVISGNSWWFAGERAHEAPTLEAAQSAAWAHWCERIGGALTKGSDA